MGEDKDAPKWRQILTDGQAEPLPWKMAAVIVGGALVIAAIIWLGSFLNEALEAGLTDPDNKFEGLRNLGLFFAALIGLPFLLWRTVIASKQSATAAEQAQLVEDRNFSDLFTKAVEQLGADKTVKRPAKKQDGTDAYDDNGIPVMLETTEPNIEVRLGAIYALQRISRASEKDHIPVMETLCAYIRENAIGGEPEDGPEGEPDWDNTPAHQIRDVAKAWRDKLREYWSPKKVLRSDVRAALTVIAQRDQSRRDIEKAESFRLDFRRANLQRAYLNEMDFEKADFANAHLQGTLFFEAKLQGASLAVAALQGSHLGRAKMQQVNLFRANLQGSDLSHADLNMCDLSAAQMQGTRLWGTNIKAADLRHTQMHGAELRISKTYSDQPYADLSRSTASCADMTAVVEIEQKTLDRFFGCVGTKLPNGLTHPDHWAKQELRDWNDAKAAFDIWTAERKVAGLPPFEDADDPT